MTGAPLLQVRNLSKRFPAARGPFSRRTGGIHAVSDVSFDVAEREVLGLAGESGSGKTTIGRSILRLIEPTAGEIVFAGEDIRGLDAAGLRGFRRSAQIIFQDPYGSINPTMSVADVVGEPLRIQGLARGSELADRIERLLADVALPADFMRRRPGDLSGGQRQRLVIARALSLDPRFIVADEPVSALDVSIQAQIVRLLQDLKERRGLTMLFISHDLALMAHLSDRIAIAYAGRLMEVGPSRAIVADPLHPYTAALLSAAPDSAILRPRIILGGDMPDPAALPSGCVFRTRCPHALPACAGEVPELRQVTPGRWKACLRDDTP